MRCVSSERITEEGMTCLGSCSLKDPQEKAEERPECIETRHAAKGQEPDVMPMSVAIEHGTTGKWYGRFVKLLGTHARSDSRDGLLRELALELEYHVKWMRLHRHDTRRLRNRSIAVVEEINGILELGESGGAVALFNFDREAIGHELLEMTLRLMNQNRMDLMKLVNGLDNQRLDFIPSAKGRSIHGILTHVCNAEEFYVSRLGPEADRVYEDCLGMPVARCDQLPIFERLPVVREACVAALRSLAPRKGASVFRRAEYTSHPEEEWTAHKVLRRFLEHEREHIYNIREYLGLPLREMSFMSRNAT